MLTTWRIPNETRQKIAQENARIGNEKLAANYKVSEMPVINIRREFGVKPNPASRPKHMDDKNHDKTTLPGKLHPEVIKWLTEQSAKGARVPNGKPIGVFVVTIDDGFCAYCYEYKPLRSCSIHDLNKRFSRALKLPICDGVYVPNPQAEP